MLYVPVLYVLIEVNIIYSPFSVITTSLLSGISIPFKSALINYSSIGLPITI